MESTFQKKEMLVTEVFIRSLVEKYGRHAVYTDDGTWYHEACNIIGLLLFTFTIREKFDGKGNQQYFKNRIESFWWLLSMHTKGDNECNLF